MAEEHRPGAEEERSRETRARGAALASKSRSHFADELSAELRERVARARAYRPTLRQLAYFLLVLLSLMAFVWGSNRHGELVNRSYKPKDQHPYMGLGAAIAETRRVQVDGARPPLYPALLALGWKAELSKEEYFERCKRIGIAATLIGWVALLFVLRRRLRPLSALAVWWALGFTVLMFYAPYVKAEAVFYVLALCSFLLTLDVIHRPTWPNAVVAGIVTGAAQLAKEALLPQVLLFVAIQALLIAIAWWRGRGKPPAERPVRSLVRRALSVGIVVGLFLVTIYPYLRANKQQFGRHFYNVNSNFYIWYDSWGQVARGTRKYGDRRGWPQMPEEDLPSARKYWETHSGEQMIERVKRGASGTLDNAMSSHGFFDYVCIAFVSGAITAGATAKTRRWLRRHWGVTAFCALYLIGYFLMCTWFYAIHPGVRFVVMLVGPVLFMGAWLSDRSRSLRWFGLLGIWAIAATASLLIDVPILVTQTVERAKGAGW